MRDQYEICLQANKYAAKAGLYLVGTGLAYQFLVNVRITNYNFIAGNLSDYGTALAVGNGVNYLTNSCGDDLKESSKFPCLFAASWIGFEFLQKHHFWPGTYDTKDILAYALGAVSVILIDLASSSERVTRITKRINPFKKKTLEERIEL